MCARSGSDGSALEDSGRVCTSTHPSVSRAIGADSNSSPGAACPSRSHRAEPASPPPPAIAMEARLPPPPPAAFPHARPAVPPDWPPVLMKPAPRQLDVGSPAPLWIARCGSCSRVWGSPKATRHNDGEPCRMTPPNPLTLALFPLGGESHGRLLFPSWDDGEGSSAGRGHVPHTGLLPS